MYYPLKLVADHISSIYLGSFQVLVLINPKDLFIDTDKIYSGIETKDHGDKEHFLKKPLRVGRVVSENYGDDEYIKKVVHVYLNDV